MVLVASYREIGGRLGAYIRGKDPGTQQIQSLISDFLADDELMLPMRDLVSRPCFRALKACAGSGSGIIQRDACLAELSRSYLPMIVSGIKDLINGMLDLPIREADPPPYPAQSDYRIEERESNDRSQVAPGRDISPLGPKEYSDKEDSPYTRKQAKALSPLRLALGTGLALFLGSLSWRAIDTSCTYIAYKASNQKYVDTAEFKSLIRTNEDRCMNNSDFATQYIRGYGSAKRCVSQSDGSCIYD